MKPLTRQLGTGALALLLSLAALARAGAAPFAPGNASPAVSGRYPHLAVFNRQNECGIGAVVPWAGRLWFLTYAPHQPLGSDDKLYELDERLNLHVRAESVGGTPAGRMIHRESDQLVIGPYFIDGHGNVRAVPPTQMPGRLTAVMHHLTEPARHVYVYDMEGALYDVDVHTLAVKKLFEKPVPGWHGKGAYTGQGLLIVGNNGESAAKKFDRPPYLVGADPKSPEEAGALATFDGTNWQIVARRQFAEVTGPAGIDPSYTKPDDPVWAVGWDKRSLILKVLDRGAWHAFRLPKSDYSYDPKHGWYTEWPRIREAATAQGDQPARLLMNMHGGWFDSPKDFRPGHTGNLRPIGTYLKITADFAPWKNQIVFGCDDASLLQNPLLGQSQSNLWFTTWNGLERAGAPVGWGGPWVKDDVRAGTASEPYLFHGYEQRVVHLSHESPHAVTFRLELDHAGDGRWEPYERVDVPPRGYAFHVFPKDLAGAWVRVVAEQDAKSASAYFHYGPSRGATTDGRMFDGLATADGADFVGGVIRPRGEDLGTLHYLTPSGGYYEIDKDLRLRHFTDKPKEAAYLKDKATVSDPGYEFDDASIVVKGPKDARYRLPKGNSQPLGRGGQLPRGVREVVTERSLLNAAGTFYVLPRDDAGGAAAIKPVCTHNRRITDFCSWRGLLVLPGTRPGAKADGHDVPADDGTAGLWLGDVDDLWKLGKPVGTGGPWKDAPVMANTPSDPYLMTGYDRKRVDLSHDAGADVTFTIEVDFLRDGTWKPYKRITVPAGQTVRNEFPTGYAAHWVRVIADRDCQATAWFVYE